MSEKQDETRERILEGARRSFESKGFAGTRIEDIASDCGVSKKTIYVHFDGKKDLLNDVLIQEIVHFREVVYEESAGKKSYSARLHQIVDESAEYLLTHPLILKMYWERTGIWGPDRPEGIEDFLMAPYEMTKSLISGGIESGEFKPVDLDATAMLMVNGFRGFFMRRHQVVGLRIDIMSMLHEGIELMLHGIRK